MINEKHFDMGQWWGWSGLLVISNSLRPHACSRRPSGPHATTHLNPYGRFSGIGLELTGLVHACKVHRKKRVQMWQLAARFSHLHFNSLRFRCPHGRKSRHIIRRYTLGTFARERFMTYEFVFMDALLLSEMNELFIECEWRCCCLKLRKLLFNESKVCYVPD